MKARFEAIRTITGGEVFDSAAGRVIDARASFGAAEREARRLNEMVAGTRPRTADRLAARDALATVS